MNEKHTALPFERVSESVYHEGCVVAACCCGGRSRSECEANATFIVRACNSHDELVVAAAWALRCLRDECVNPDARQPGRASSLCEEALEAALAHVES